MKLLFFSTSLEVFKAPKKKRKQMNEQTNDKSNKKTILKSQFDLDTQVI